MRTGDGTLRADIDRTGEGVGIAADFRRGVVDLPVQLLQSQPYRGHAAKHLGVGRPLPICARCKPDVIRSLRRRYSAVETAMQESADAILFLGLQRCSWNGSTEVDFW